VSGLLSDVGAAVPEVWGAVLEVCASASLGGTAKPTAAANPNRETILRRDIVSHSSFFVISRAPDFDPQNFGSAFAGDTDLYQKLTKVHDADRPRRPLGQP
jgi:hypothetical protein